MNSEDFKSLMRGMEEALEFVRTNGAGYQKRVVIGPSGREIVVLRKGGRQARG